ncbi:sulfatase [Baia soyae]|uniref:Arylsulfatase A-like enzyme n=1 Tax=Baia soyae TaxID=1544746 RepID=A0A4R2RIV6_9BACL|nr:sulfatase [Baia soyae]TCP63742.1 arylsulfatase A-like enzyme [Baia soyae]
MKIILIAIDTLRADRLGCYGYHNDISPNIDGLAKDGVLFENMIAENNVTQSSFTTMLTGKNPYQHGIVNMKPTKIPQRLIPLPVFLQRKGYKTAAVDCNYRITGKSNPWFKKGFDTYLDPSENRPTHLNLSAKEINQSAIPWLKKHAQDPDFFLFLHYWDPHYPYQPEGEFADWSSEQSPVRAQANEPSLKACLREPLWSFISKYNQDQKSIAQIQKDYDGTVKQVDHYIGELVEEIKQLGIYEDTMIILTSDHGESLGEHNIFFDHHGLYESTLHVPLMITCPQKLPSQKRVSRLVQHADIVPTIMDLAEIPIPKEMGPIDGTSLLDFSLANKQNHRPFVVSCEANWQCKRSIRNQQWKLIQSLERDVYGNPKFELYNIKQDPHEKKNVISEHPQVARHLQHQMKKWVAQMLRKYRRPDPLTKGVKVKMNRLTVAEEEKVKKRLSELGY